MVARRTSQISPRKAPQQARSNALVRAVLTAAIQVLAKEGASRFTMARVAEKAGVSVGSLYQYFPNKGSILFRLQSEEWRETTGLMCRILDDRRLAPLDRVRTLVHAFVQSECDEAAVRIALDDAAPLYRDAPEARQARESVEAALRGFLLDVLPEASDGTRALAGELLATTLGAVGKHLSEVRRTPDETRVRADALADMLCAYLRSVRATSKRGTTGRKAVRSRRAGPRPRGA